MGIITNLIRMNEEKKSHDRQSEIANWQAILAAPDDIMPHAQKVWASQNLSGLLGGALDLPKGKHGIIHGLISQLANLNPMPGAPKPPAGPRPEFKPISEEQGKQIRQSQAEEEPLAKADAARKSALADLQAAGVDPTSSEGQARLLGKASGRAAPSTDPDDKVIALRTSRANTLGLTGDARTEYILENRLPSGFGNPLKTPTPKEPTANDLAFADLADRLHKPPESLTPHERVEAVRNYKRETSIKAGGGKANGTEASKNHAIAKASASTYTPGGPSIANPGGRDGYVEGAAWSYITEGKMPFIGMSTKKGEPNKRELAVARSGEILANLGISWAELPAIRANLKANSGALNKVNTQATMVETFEETASLNMNTAAKLSDKYARTQSPFVNRIVGGIQQNTGDADVNNFLAQMRTLASEYSKIMSGATSSTGAHVGDVEEATKFINGYLGKGQLEGLFQVMRVDFANRQKSFDDEKDKLVQKIRNPMAGFGNGSATQSMSASAATGPNKATNGTAPLSTQQPKQRRRRLSDGSYEYQHTMDGKTWQPGPLQSQ